MKRNTDATEPNEHEETGYALTADGIELVRIVNRQDAGENMNGVHALPSGRYFGIANQSVSYPLSLKEAQDWYHYKMEGKPVSSYE